jgi:hypothetical protein
VCLRKLGDRIFGSKEDELRDGDNFVNVFIFVVYLTTLSINQISRGLA